MLRSNHSSGNTHPRMSNNKCSVPGGVQVVLTTQSGSLSQTATMNMPQPCSAILNRRGMQTSSPLTFTAAISASQASMGQHHHCLPLNHAWCCNSGPPLASTHAGPACERFGREHHAPACKMNELRWCQTDLGANVLRWPRWMREGRRFGGMAAQCACKPFWPEAG